MQCSLSLFISFAVITHLCTLHPLVAMLTRAMFAISSAYTDSTARPSLHCLPSPHSETPQEGVNPSYRDTSSTHTRIEALLTPAHVVLAVGVRRHSPLSLADLVRLQQLSSPAVRNFIEAPGRAHVTHCD